MNPAVVTIGRETRQFWVLIRRGSAIHDDARAHVFGVVARLGPGITLERAEAELRGLDARPGVRGSALAYDHPLEANWTDGFMLSGELQRPDEPARRNCES